MSSFAWNGWTFAEEDIFVSFFSVRDDKPLLLALVLSTKMNGRWRRREFLSGLDWTIYNRRIDEKDRCVAIFTIPQTQGYAEGFCKLKWYFRATQTQQIATETEPSRKKASRTHLSHATRLYLRSLPVKGVIHLSPHLSPLDTPGEVRHRHQNEAITRLQDTGHRVVPG